MTDTTTIPAGWVRDARGRLHAESSLRPIDRLRDDLVRKIAERATELHKLLAEFRCGSMADIAAFVELAAEEYDTALGGKKGNLTLHTFDGEYRVQVQRQDRMQFDEGLQVAQSLIMECLTDWTGGAPAELRTVVNETFAPDQEGKVNMARVLGLRRWDIKDPRWITAMEAIGKALQVIATATYLRVHKRDAAEKFQPITLDLQGV